MAPGLIRTPLTQAITNNEIALKASTAFHPVGRIGEPEDVAAAILWLLSDESAFATADVIAVDGGISSIKLRPYTGYLEVLFLGLLFGMVTYGTYDLTNQVTLKNWPWIVTVIDIAWGSCLVGAVSLISTFVTRYFW